MCSVNKLEDETRILISSYVPIIKGLRETIYIHYRNGEVEELYSKNSGVKTEGSAGFDLVTCEDVTFNGNCDFKLVDLGIVVKPSCDGFHFLIMPRSSTFMRYKLIQTNSVGLIDADYSGKNDYLKVPLLYMGQGQMFVPKGTRLCQLLLYSGTKISELLKFDPQESRGGFGSTGE